MPLLTETIRQNSNPNGSILVENSLDFSFSVAHNARSFGCREVNKMLKRLLAVGLIVGAVASLGLSAGPVFGDDNVVVTATVTPATPCVTVTSLTISYGTRSFATSSTGDSSATADPLTVVNCGDTSENVWARGADATGASATWSLSSLGTQTTCYQDGFSSPVTLNRYKHRIDVGTGASLLDIYLTINNAAMGSLAGGNGVQVIPMLYMPCSGSDGAGQLMSTTITFTATY